MPIAERTIKNLFAKSQNRCANPDCSATLVINETILGEICHIRARRKGGARYDPNLTEPEKNAAANLILLCPTCHTLVDKDKTGAFSVFWLEKIKADHERRGAFELTAREARAALAILARSKARGKRFTTQVSSKADRGGIAISIGGCHNGDIHLRTPANKGTRGYANNSIGADANLSGYVDYLCDLYVRYMSQTGATEDSLRGRIGKHIKTKFRLAKRTRNDLPAERFWELVDFLNGKLAVTPVGKKHIARGTKLCSTFEEWRSTIRR